MLQACQAQSMTDLTEPCLWPESKRIPANARQVKMLCKLLYRLCIGYGNNQASCIAAQSAQYVLLAFVPAPVYQQRSEGYCRDRFCMVCQSLLHLIASAVA